MKCYKDGVISVRYDEDGILEVSENEICCYSCIHWGDDWCYAQAKNGLIEIKNPIKKECSHYQSIWEFKE